MLCLSCQIISNVSFQIIGLWISFTNEECFDLNHSLRSLLYFIHQNQRNRSGLSFQLADLLSLFIFVPCFNVGNSFEARTPRKNTEEDKKLTTDFVMDWRDFLMCFDFVLSLGVQDPLITPVVSIDWIVSFWGVGTWLCFCLFHCICFVFLFSAPFN